MKKLPITLLGLTMLCLSAWTPSPALACNTCGCGPSLTAFGIAPYAPYHTLGWRLSAATAQTVLLPSLAHRLPLRYAMQTTLQSDLFGQFVLGSRWQVQASIPYFQRSQRDELTTPKLTQANGWGDAQVLVNHRLYFKAAKALSAQRFTEVWAGLGAVLPTAAWETPAPESTLLPVVEATNFGQGAYQPFARLGFHHANPRLGLRAEAQGRLPLANPNGYRFGTQFVTQALAYNVFTRKRGDKTQVWMPSLGATGFFQGVDIEQASDGNRERPNRAGHAVSLLASLDWQKNRVGVGLRAQVPVTQDWHTNGLSYGPQGNLTLAYFFSSKRLKTPQTRTTPTTSKTPTPPTP